MYAFKIYPKIKDGRLAAILDFRMSSDFDLRLFLTCSYYMERRITISEIITEISALTFVWRSIGKSVPMATMTKRLGRFG